MFHRKTPLGSGPTMILHPKPQPAIRRVGRKPIAGRGRSTRFPVACGKFRTRERFANPCLGELNPTTSGGLPRGEPRRIPRWSCLGHWSLPVIARLAVRG